MLKRKIKQMFQSKFFSALCALSFSLLSIGIGFIVASSTPVRAETITFGGGFVQIAFVNYAPNRYDSSVMETERLLIVNAWYNTSGDSRNHPAGFGSFDYMQSVHLWSEEDKQTILEYQTKYPGLTLQGWDQNGYVWNASGDFNPNDNTEFRDWEVYDAMINDDHGLLPRVPDIYDDSFMPVNAVWQANREVTFDADGGSFTGYYEYRTDTYTTYTFGDDEDEWFFFTEQETDISNPEVPIPTRENYFFGGWWTGENGTGIQYYSSTGELVYANADADLNADVTLYANWIAGWADSDILQPGGAGTEASPYLITCEEELAWISYESNFKGNSFEGVYFKQTEELDLDGVDWLPIGMMDEAFQGSYDGSEHTIYNMKTPDDLDGDYYLIENAGLFGKIGQNSQLKNIYIEDAHLYTKGYAGFIAAQSEDSSSTIQNCYVLGGEIWGKSSNEIYIGGIIGATNSDVNDCKVENGEISAFKTNSVVLGGIVGFGCGNFDGCEAVRFNINATEVKTNAEMGGIVGCSWGTETIKDCNVTSCNIIPMVPESGSACVGGIAGKLFSYSSSITIDSCKVESCRIQDTTNSSVEVLHMGGIVGCLNTTQGSNIINCTSENNYILDLAVPKTECSYSGGIVGALQDTLSKVEGCVSKNNQFRAKNSIGGIVAIVEKSATISDCEVLICTNSDTSDFGGILGYKELIDGEDKISITDCLVEFAQDITITATDSIGGIVGSVCADEVIIQNNVCICESGNEVYLKAARDESDPAFAGGIGGSVSGSSVVVQNCIVSGLNIECKSGYAFCGGLLGYSSSDSSSENAQVSQCTVENCEIYLVAYADSICGGLIGAIAPATVTDCSVINTIIDANDDEGGSTLYIGGVIGYATGSSVKDCTFDASALGDECNITVDGTDDWYEYTLAIVGGLVGEMDGTLSNSTVFNLIISANNTQIVAGGICGKGSWLTAKDCLVQGLTIDSYDVFDHAALGGLIGVSASDDNLENCLGQDIYIYIDGVYEDYNEDASMYIGGYVGYASDWSQLTIYKCAVTNTHIWGGLYDGDGAAGGFIGRVAEHASASISQSLFDGYVTIEDSSDYSALLIGECAGSADIIDVLIRGAYIEFNLFTDIVFGDYQDIVIECSNGDNTYYYYDDTANGHVNFSGWGIANGQPLPKELFWIASGAEECTIDALEALGYDSI